MARAATSKHVAPGNRNAAWEGSPSTQANATTSTHNFASSATLNGTFAKDFFCYHKESPFLRFCFSEVFFGSP